jgi:hypothetical protein
MTQVELRFNPSARWVALRELNGFDEQALDGTHTLSAIAFLDRLLIDPPGGAAGREKTGGLTASDRDRLLAAVYTRTFGPRLVSSARCGQCSQMYDLSFSLDQLLAQQDRRVTGPGEQLSDATFRLPNGCVFRLPTGSDECAVAGLPPDKAGTALISRCVLESGTAFDPEPVYQAWELAAPLLDLELHSVCPECSKPQNVHFDIQSYLLNALLQERDQLIRDVHRLARAYGWGLHEILGLPRSQRLAMVKLAESEPR